MPNQRSQLIVLAEPVSPTAKPPLCRWCGLEIEYTDAATSYRQTRTYHRGDKFEIGDRNCRREHKLSFCWSGRDALRWQASQKTDDGTYILGCVDCGQVVEEGKSQVRRRAGARFRIDTPIGKDGRFQEVRWEADHQKPLIDGGQHTLENLRCRCIPCHKAKTVNEAKARAHQMRHSGVLPRNRL